MSYRGEDLDLRTPQTWSGTPSDLAANADPYLNGAGSRGRAGYNRNAPILVDDIVLACSNHAFDVAVAHRASEVRLEHLLHAMTRVDGASNALEARGIRVAGLRRESATIIASEIPIGLSAGQTRPRRSDDFESALRTASAIAYRRNAPANMDDVLDALLDMPSDISGIALLARHGGRVARDRAPIRDREPIREPVRDRMASREPLPLPPLTRSTPTYAPEPILEPRKSAYYTSELPRPATSDFVGTPVDGIQNARIDQLENAVRTLTSDLANERKVERDDTNRFRGGLHDRLQSLEQTMLAATSDDSRGQLHDRMKSLEYTVLNNRNDGGDASQLIERIAAIERGLDQRLGELARPWGVLSDRLQGLEQAVLDTRGSTGPDPALMDRLAGVERAVNSFNAKPLDLSPIANRLDIIEEAVLSPDSSQGGDKLAGHLRSLEEAVVAQRALVVQSNQALNNDVKALASALAQQSAGNERVQSFISERMQTLSSGFERQRAELTGPLTERINALATGLDGRMQSFAGLVDRQRSDVASAIDDRATETQRSIASLIERMSALEAQQSAAQAAHAAELKEVHEALIKLNTNQHTLAGSIDQWRLDGVGDINVIANRLDGIERTAGKPLEMMQALTTSVDNINRATVERYHRRNRFWYWLFGTDDWLTASWPSQVASVEAERTMLRGSLPKVTPPPQPSVPKL